MPRLRFESRSEWRQWLLSNHSEHPKGIWMLNWKKVIYSFFSFCGWLHIDEMNLIMLEWTYKYLFLVGDWEKESGLWRHALGGTLLWLDRWPGPSLLH